MEQPIRRGQRLRDVAYTMCLNIPRSGFLFSQEGLRMHY